MINETSSNYDLYSTNLEDLVGGFPDGKRRQDASFLLEFVKKLRNLVGEPDFEESYADWFGQVREGLSGRGSQNDTVERLKVLVEEYDIPHQFVFDFIKGISVEANAELFRDFAALETCAYLNSSAVLICLAIVLGERAPDENGSKGIDEKVCQGLMALGLTDYLLNKLANFIPQMESKVYYLAIQEVQDRGLDLSNLSEPIDDGLWKDLIQFQCRRILERLQSAVYLTEIPAGRLRNALNRLTNHNLILLKKIRRMPTTNLRSQVELSWTDRMRAWLGEWKQFQIPNE